MVYVEKKKRDKANVSFRGREGGASEIIITYYYYQCLLKLGPHSGIYLTPAYAATTYVKMILGNPFPTLQRRLN